MNSNLKISAMGVILVGAITVSMQLSAQEQSAPQNSRRKHHHYKLIEIGTFGGPTSAIAGAPSRVLTNHGTVIGFRRHESFRSIQAELPFPNVQCSQVIPLARRETHGTSFTREWSEQSGILGK